MSIVFGILKFLGVFILLILATFLCKTFVFPKIRINKFIPLAISIVLLLIEFILPLMKLLDKFNNFNFSDCSFFMVLRNTSNRWTKA